MESGMKYEKIALKLIEKYGKHLKSNEIATRDRALVCYYLIKRGETDKAIPFIEKVATHIKTGEANYYDAAFGLWVLGEYLKNTNHTEMTDAYTSTVSASLKRIAQLWDKPGRNWMGISKENGVYLAGISIAYGAIRSINQFFRSDTAQKLMIDMRAFVMSNFLKKGEVVRVVSKLGDNTVYGDIGNTAVPFGLLEVADRILVEAVDSLEKSLDSRDVGIQKNEILPGGFLRTETNCLLSWYYSEKGDFSRAESLLEQSEKIWDRTKQTQHNYRSLPGFIVYAIAKQNLFLKHRVKGFVTDNALNIIHVPLGSEDPYYFQNIERYPRNPEVGDEVVLKIMTQPFHPSQEVFVEYNVNGGQTLRSQLYIETAASGGKYWKINIGKYAGSDKVEYRFLVQDNQNSAVSESFHFVVRQWKPIGRITHTRWQKDEISLIFTPLEYSSKMPCLRISKHNEKTASFSLAIEDVADIEKRASGYLLSDDTPDLPDIRLEEWDLKVKATKFIVNFAAENADILKSYHAEDIRFIELLTDKSGIVYKVRVNFFMAPDEKFFGMGERFSHLQFRGMEVDNYVYNQYRDQGLKTYMPVPFTISSMGYGIYADTDMYSVFRFGTKQDDRLEIEMNLNGRKQISDLFVFCGKPGDVIQEFAGVTGLPKLLPKWAFGLWISSNNWDSQALVYEQIKLSNKYKIPATALVLEQWSDEATYYIFNDAEYKTKPGDDYLRYEDFSFPEWGRWPDPKKMVEDIHKEGIKVFLWQIPFEKHMKGVVHAQRDEDERVMLEKGYHVKRKSGKAYRTPYDWFSDSLVLDFTNPMAKEWWFNKRRYLVSDIGIDGFKTDGGECIFSSDLVFFDGRTGDEMRNRYPNDYIGSYHAFLKKYLPDEVTFSRAGYTGAQAFPIHWAGDERSTYKAFRASLTAGLSAGMSGIPFWGWDLAGFHGDIPTAELYIRCTQMAVFCPIMQYHAETRGEYNQDRTPWNIAERTDSPYVTDLFKKYTDLRMNLIPYIYEQAVKSTLTGLPMMRAMFVAYPSDKYCTDMISQYMFGDNLLVAPVMEEGICTREVYLPEGKWMNFFTGEILSGNRFVTEEVGIEQIPVYIKENSVIPLNLSDTYKLFSYVGNRTDQYENLTFLIFATERVKYSFTVDIGSDVHIACYQAGSIINVRSVSNYNGDYLLIVRNSKDITKVELNGKVALEHSPETLEAGAFAVDGTDLILKVDGRSANTGIATHL